MRQQKVKTNRNAACRQEVHCNLQATLTYLFAGYSYLANSRGGVIQLCPANTGVG